MNSKQYIANAFVHMINGDKDAARASFINAIKMKSRPFVNEAKDLAAAGIITNELEEDGKAEEARLKKEVTDKKKGKTPKDGKDCDKDGKAE